MNEQIQHIGANVCQEIIERERLKSSCEQFWNEAGAQLNSLMDCQGVIAGGVENLEQAVGNKLTENEERNVKKWQVLDTFRNNAQEIIRELGINR